MIATLLALLAAAQTAGVCAYTASVQPKDLPGLPCLVLAERSLSNFVLTEDLRPIRAQLLAELLLVTPLADGAEAADTALLALLDLLPTRGFAPARGNQVEANWGRREVILGRLVITTTLGFQSS